MAKLESLVCGRFKTVDDIANEIEKLTGEKCVVFESESDLLDDTDYMLDYYFPDSEDIEEDFVGTIFYLKDRAGNYYITEV